MEIKSFEIEGIPAIVWGGKSDKVYIYVHGKMSCKEEAEWFAEQGAEKGYQVLSFDLPEHGARKQETRQCNVWNAVEDLKVISQYAEKNWATLNLYANSLGAYFSLLAYKELLLEKCLFLSPVLDMEKLIQKMMVWADVSPEVLQEKGEIFTPMGETLSWKYYCFAKENPIVFWKPKTAILYGSEDTLTEVETVKDFAKRFHCSLTVAEGFEHYFHTPQQLVFLKNWVKERI